MHLRNLSLFLYTLLHSGHKITPSVVLQNFSKSVIQPMLSVQSAISGFLHPSAQVERTTRDQRNGKKIHLWVLYAATCEHKEMGKSILNPFFLSKINCFPANFTRLSTGCVQTFSPPASQGWEQHSRERIHFSSSNFSREKRKVVGLI